MNKFYVYIHKRATDNLPFYVGKGSNKRAFSKSGRSSWWNRVVAKHGFYVEIVFDSLSEEDSFQVEKDTILEFNYFGYPLVNLTSGGEGTSGHKQSHETISKRVAKNKGKKRTEESKKKISDALTGLKRTDEVRARISESKKVLSGLKKLLKKGQPETEVGKGLNHLKRSYLNLQNKTPKNTNLSGRTSERNKDRTVYEFYHPIHGTFIGIRFDFCKKYGIPTARVCNYFSKNQKTVLGWTIKEHNDSSKT